MPNFLATGILADNPVRVWRLSTGRCRVQRLGARRLSAALCPALPHWRRDRAVIFFIGVVGRHHIHRPLTWWRNGLPASLRKPLARLWPALLGDSTVAERRSAALYLATIGYIACDFADMTRLLDSRYACQAIVAALPAGLCGRLCLTLTMLYRKQRRPMPFWSPMPLATATVESGRSSGRDLRRPG
ncbi:MAG: hypothetical protein R3E79_55895 [Caldilineaceae bacterium]